jgi:hypothetical protein
MNQQRIIREWIESTQDAINELSAWLDSLREWEQAGGELMPGDFSRAFDRLYRAGLGDGWADWNQAGGGLDALAEAVKGEL